jgi:integrase
MPRKAAGLTAAKVKSAKPGRYGDGAGLYLLVRPPAAHHGAGARDGGRYWLFRYRIDGRMREAGLGLAAGATAVSLAEVREQARELHRMVRAGMDPLAERGAKKAATAAERQAAARALSFRDVADRYIAAHEAGWRNAVHRQQWTNTLRDYVHPHFGDVPVADVDTAHVMAALEPIWREKPETASRTRGRIEMILDFAKAHGWQSGENPARWRGHIANILPKRSKLRPVNHFAALPWREMGAFMAALRAEGGLAARALELAILTAARSGEVLNARWEEFGLDEAVWIVPANRMKAHKEHRVPLTQAAVALLRKLLPLRNVEQGDWVFPGRRAGRPVSDMAMVTALRRMQRDDLTVHGFRSTFRDWCAESTNHQHEVAKAALAHTVGNGVEAAYRRGDLFEKRRQMMEDWAAFCGPPGLAGMQPAR